MLNPFNWKSEREKRKKLRNNMPQPELTLWRYLKSKQLKGYKFRRQVSIGKFIVDFYCHKAKLAVEIDGNSHYEEKAIDYDKFRTEWINKHGVKVIRFTNKDINNSIEGVVGKIEKYLKE